MKSRRRRISAQFAELLRRIEKDKRVRQLAEQYWKRRLLRVATKRAFYHVERPSVSPARIRVLRAEIRRLNRVIVELINDRQGLREKLARYDPDNLLS
jgi:hypothetical protein